MFPGDTQQTGHKSNRSTVTLGVISCRQANYLSTLSSPFSSPLSLPEIMLVTFCLNLLKPDQAASLVGLPSVKALHGLVDVPRLRWVGTLGQIKDR